MVKLLLLMWFDGTKSGMMRGFYIRFTGFYGQSWTDNVYLLLNKGNITFEIISKRKEHETKSSGRGFEVVFYFSIYETKTCQTRLDGAQT